MQCCNVEKIGGMWYRQGYWDGGPPEKKRRMREGVERVQEKEK